MQTEKRIIKLRNKRKGRTGLNRWVESWTERRTVITTNGKSEERSYQWKKRTNIWMQGLSDGMDRQTDGKKDRHGYVK